MKTTDIFDDENEKALAYLHNLCTLRNQLCHHTYIYTGYLELRGEQLWTLRHVVDQLINNTEFQQQIDVVALKEKVSLLADPQVPKVQQTHDATIVVTNYEGRFDEFCTDLRDLFDKNIRLELSSGQWVITKASCSVSSTDSGERGLHLQLGESPTCFNFSYTPGNVYVHYVFFHTDVDSCFGGSSTRVNLDFVFQFLYDFVWLTQRQCTITLLDSSYFLEVFRRPREPDLERVEDQVALRVDRELFRDEDSDEDDPFKLPNDDVVTVTLSKHVPYLLAYRNTFYSRSTPLVPKVDGPWAGSAEERFKEYQGTLALLQERPISGDVSRLLQHTGLTALLAENAPKTYRELGELIIDLASRPHFLGGAYSSIMVALEDVIKTVTYPEEDEDPVGDALSACNSEHCFILVPKKDPKLFQRQNLRKRKRA